MEKLTKEQKQMLIEKMNQNDGVGFDRWAEWVKAAFDVVVTSQECSRLFMTSLLG